MIRTLIVDDDFRVAQIHADRVSRVDGFQCVGQAHSAAQARAAIAQLKPDLLLLDIYLPDEDGLSLLRSLRSAADDPDCILITAARDLKTVRSAMRSGAIYYLVKPFGFEQLRRELTAYRQWRKHLAEDGIADQSAVDSLYGMLHAQNQDSAGGRRLPPAEGPRPGEVGRPAGGRRGYRGEPRDEPAHRATLPQRVGAQGHPRAAAGIRCRRTPGQLVHPATPLAPGNDSVRKHRQAEVASCRRRRGRRRCGRHPRDAP